MLELKADVSSSILIFIATIINQEVFKYSYGRNCMVGIKSVTIKLTVQYNKDIAIFIDNNIYTYKENMLQIDGS